MRAAPYNLVKDDQVWVKIISINTYGESVLSEPFDGSVIRYVPDAPINFANVVEITDATMVGFVWDEGDNGGTPVIDWRIWYALVGEDY